MYHFYVVVQIFIVHFNDNHCCFYYHYYYYLVSLYSLKEYTQSKVDNNNFPTLNMSSVEPAILLRLTSPLGKNY